MEIKAHTDRNTHTTQSDFGAGAVDIRSTDSNECFELGRLIERLIASDIQVVHGDCAGGKFLRIPLTPNDAWKEQVRDLLERDGQLIPAIKLCRQLTGWNLRDAKLAVERLQGEL